MPETISLESVANIILFIVPGYIATRTYCLVYSQADKDFSRMVLESIVWSLPIVSTYTFLWRWLPGSNDLVPTRLRFVLPLVILSVLAGLVTAWLRRKHVAKRVLRKLGLPLDPDQDFIRAQFRKLARNEVVTVTLQNGDVFSGLPVGGSPYREGVKHYYYFNDVAWYNKATDKWDDRPGSVIIAFDDVLHIETNAQIATE